MNKLQNASTIFLFFLAIQFGVTQNEIPKDTSISTWLVKVKPTSLILPLSLFALGTYSIHQTTFINRFAIKDWRNRTSPSFNTDIDDYLQHLGLVGGFAVGAFGKKDKLWLYTKRVLFTEIVTNTFIQIIKKQSHILRPNDSDYLSFPSGHTTEAFAGAILFNDHFARGKPLLQVISLSAATSVGVMRVLKNRHWANDVIAGAGFGILSAKLSEIVFR